MPEIGATLREARMRARIDISEIESATKIRAKYLRALENEEWDLLPGPTYVKSFLRTYAEALGLDAKLLVDEYKMRHQRLSEVEMQPIGAAAAGRERRRQGPVIPRPVTIGVIFLLLAAALWALGSGADDDPAPSPTTPTASTPVAGAEDEPAAPRRSAPSPVVTLQIVATGEVNVCLRAGDRTLIDGTTLQAGESSQRFRSRRFRLTLGNSNARLRINGRERTVEPSSEPIGLEITRARGRQPLSAQERPVCR